MLSTPINREGQALVDGGLINNVPANVLAMRGCIFVIAVSVTTSTGELATIGETTTLAAAPQILSLLNRVDSGLFPASFRPDAADDGLGVTS